MDETISLLQIEGWELSWNRDETLQRARTYCVPDKSMIISPHYGTVWELIKTESCVFMQKKQAARKIPTCKYTEREWKHSQLTQLVIC